MLNDQNSREQRAKESFADKKETQQQIHFECVICKFEGMC